MQVTYDETYGMYRAYLKNFGYSYYAFTKKAAKEGAELYLKAVEEDCQS